MSTVTLEHLYLTCPRNKGLIFTLESEAKHVSTYLHNHGISNRTRITPFGVWANMHTKGVKHDATSYVEVDDIDPRTYDLILRLIRDESIPMMVTFKGVYAGFDDTVVAMYNKGEGFKVTHHDLFHAHYCSYEDIAKALRDGLTAHKLSEIQEKLNRAHRVKNTNYYWSGQEAQLKQQKLRNIVAPL